MFSINYNSIWVTVANLIQDYYGVLTNEISYKSHIPIITIDNFIDDYFNYENIIETYVHQYGNIDDAVTTAVIIAFVIKYINETNGLPISNVELLELMEQSFSALYVEQFLHFKHLVNCVDTAEISILNRFEEFLVILLIFTFIVILLPYASTLNQEVDQVVKWMNVPQVQLNTSFTD